MLLQQREMMEYSCAAFIGTNRCNFYHRFKMERNLRRFETIFYKTTLVDNAFSQAIYTRNYEIINANTVIEI
jgi:hypothetical protein